MQKKLADNIKEKVQKIAEDENQLNILINKVKKKLAGITNSGNLKQLFSSIEVLIEMIKSYLSGEYKNYPKKTLFLILFGLIYFLTPLDAIPDFIPITGLIDDLTVLLWVYRSVKKDIEMYLQWKNQKITSTN